MFKEKISKILMICGHATKKGNIKLYYINYIFTDLNLSQ